ncbi:unnamed protein product [Leptosia nina]|uniref:C2H2-type domain-containing protein n=1 Tax=Leptosia nina TaxID=320188 RepID=A0AAV1J5V1_9NEOP
MALTIGSNKFELKLTTIDLVGGIFCNVCKATFRNKVEYDIHFRSHSGRSSIVYTCVICHKDFNLYACFRGHCYNNHVIKNRYTCEHCNKHFSKLQSLQEHNKSKHMIKCPDCNDSFLNKKELNIHRVIIHKEEHEEQTCRVCHSEIRTLEECKEHIDLHRQYVYSCPICQEEIAYIEDSVKHLKTHFSIYDSDDAALTPENVLEQLCAISCSICSVVCPNRVEFDSHFSSVHADKDIIYTCIVCGKEFDKYSQFRLHINRHYTDNKFECDTCNEPFSCLSKLVAHVSGCAGATDRKKHKPYVCFHCGHRYFMEHSLFKHISDAHNGFDFRCKEPGCDLVFEKRRDLLLHSRQHNSKVQNWCRQCGQDFISLAACKEHLEVHKKNNHTCIICNKNYTEMTYLLKHIVFHFKTKVYVCKECGKTYSAKRRLLQHMKTHSTIKIHACTHCPKTFAKSSHLLQHLPIHTGEKSFQCTICDKKFTCSANLNKHQGKMHLVPSNKPTDNIKAVSAVKRWRLKRSFKKEIEKDLQLFESEKVIDPKVHILTSIIEEPHTNPNLPAPNSDIVPLEYGPEIMTVAIDDHMLPHIDPLLTIRTEETMPQQNICLEGGQTFVDMQNYDFNQTDIESQNWAPPMLTKVYCSYEDTNCMTIVNTDIF